MNIHSQSPYTRNFKFWTFKDVSLRSHIQSCKFVRVSGIHSHVCVSPTGGCASVSFTVKVKVAQLCPTLGNPMDYTVHGILQARILEWVAFPFSRGSSRPRNRTHVSRIAGGFLTSWATREAQYHTAQYRVQ